MTRNEDKLKRLAKKHFIEFIEDDYTELWILSEFIYDNLLNPTKNKVLKLVKEIVSELITEKGIWVIDVETELRSVMTRQQIFSHIDLIFEKTKGRPTIGDGIWFSIDNEKGGM